MVTRLLVYSQDGLGLGHLRRTRNIAQEVLSREPLTDILIMADSPAGPFFPTLPGIRYLKLPTIIKTDKASWRASTPFVNVKDVLNRRSRMIIDIFRQFKPDLVLVDHMPVGALGELKPLLDSAMAGPARPKLFLGLRDVLDSPKVISKVWRELDAFHYLQGYDAVLIYGCRELYDTVSAYQLTPNCQAVYCHYVGPSERVRLTPRPLEEPLLLVMGGGGADLFPLASSFLEALRFVRRQVQFRAVILTGPNMPLAERQALTAQAAGQPVDIRCEDATSWLGQASAVLTMAGYNSLCEVLAWRKKALVVPRAGPSAEQRIRSRLFSERRLIRMLDPDDLTPWRLAHEVSGLLTTNEVPDPSNIPLLDGAQKAANVILGGPVSAGEGAPVGGLAAQSIGG